MSLPPMIDEGGNACRWCGDASLGPLCKCGRCGRCVADPQTGHAPGCESRPEV